MSVNRVGNNLYIKPYEQYEVKPYAQNGVDNPILSFQANSDTCTKTTQNYQENEIIDITSLKQDLEKTKSEQGILGKLWDGFKNLTGIGASSSKAEQAIEDYENGLISVEEMEHAVNGYQEGQKMAVDVVADMTSGMISIVAFGAATAALGPVGALLIAGTTGAISKVGIKAGDALATGKEYASKNLLYDTVSGGINGLLGPITNGIGNTVTKTIATKFGISVLKEGAEELAEQGIKQGFKQFAKSIVLNQSDDIIGGTLEQRAIALGAGMAIDGALGGAADNMARAGLEGEDILKAGAQGFVGGLIMAPIIGGGMKIAGKAGKALNNKITTSKVLSDGMNTTFKQGATGDCALLSTLDGMMSNPNTVSKVKNSITRTAFDDYEVKIGDKIVRVSKDALSDEILSDTTGIKLFEVAYRQMGGSIDGEFAEVVAKQFGLNPIHITSETITDELLERISKDSDNLVLSLGIDGHYYSIKGIDPQTKIVTLADPYDTSKTLKMSFDEVKTKGASIDGGSVKATDLPNVGRSGNDIEFKGIKSKYGDLEIVNESYTDIRGKKQVKRRIYLAQDKKRPLEYYEICKILAPEQQEFFIDADKNLSVDTTNYARYGAMDGELTFISDKIEEKLDDLKPLYKDLFGEEPIISKDTNLLPIHIRDIYRKINKEAQNLIDKQSAKLKSTYQNATGKELILGKKISEITYALQKALEELEGKDIPSAELENFNATFDKFKKLNELDKYSRIIQTSAFDYTKTDERMLGFDIHSKEAAMEQTGTSIGERSKSEGKKSVLLHNQDKKMFLLGDTILSDSDIKEADLFDENRIYLTHQEFMDCINLIRNYHFMDSVRIEDKYVGGQRFISTKGFNDGDYGSLHSLHRIIQNFGLDENGKLDLNKLQATLDLISEGLYKDFRNNESLFSNTGKSSTDAQAGLLISHGKTSGRKTTILFKDNNDPNSKDIITAIFDSDGCLYTIYKQDVEGTKDFIPFKTFNA